MNPQTPVGNGNPKDSIFFTEKALAAKFSFSFTRKQLVILKNVLSPIQFPLADLRNKVLGEMLDEIDKAAFNSITDSDLVQPENMPTAPLPPVNQIQTK